MPRQFHLTIQAEGRSDTTIAGEFSDEEAATLDAFLSQQKELAESKPLREGTPCNISVNYSEESGLQISSELPSRDDLSILLHRLRPFILQNEPASFAKASNILGKHLTDPLLRQFIARQRELYDGRLAQKMMRVVSDEQVLNSEEVLSNWLNSHEYHRDPDKRATIDELFERVPSELLNGLLVSMIVDKTKAVINVASVVAVILGRNTKLQFKTHA